MPILKAIGAEDQSGLARETKIPPDTISSGLEPPLYVINIVVLLPPPVRNYSSSTGGVCLINGIAQ